MVKEYKATDANTKTPSTKNTFVFDNNGLRSQKIIYKWINKNTGMETSGIIKNVPVKIDTANPPLIYMMLFVLKIFFTVIFLFVIIYIPILFFLIIKPILKGHILSTEVARRTTRMDWILISLFAFMFLLFDLGDYIATKQMINLPGYEITLNPTDWTLLILGLVTLMLGEILKYTLKMKEEQDLII